jgi:hypothetical protein
MQALTDSSPRLLTVERRMERDKFAALYESDEDAALNYLRNDLKMTAGVAHKLGVS